MHTDTCDVLVIGAGGAGLRAGLAAIEAAPDIHVALVTKGSLGQSGVTATACSDRMAFHATLKHTKPGGPDNWRYHAEDIYRIGGCVSDGDLAAILARGAQAAFDYLDALGVPFVKRDGLADQFVTDGSKYARACYTGPHTANHIEQALVRRIRQTSIELVEDAMLVDLLLTSDGAQVAGAVILASNEIKAIRAKAIVLATGGVGEAFEVNVYPPGMTGDGYAGALRAGAELINMEFIQIGLSSVKTKLACSGSMMRAIPRVINDQDEEFLARYFPVGTPPGQVYSVLFAKGASWPVSLEEKSHIMDIAVFREMVAGRKVYLDYSRNPHGFDPSALDGKATRWFKEAKGVDLTHVLNAPTPLARLKAINPQSVAWLQARGIDMDAGDKVEIAPAIQHFQGGVKIRTEGNTNLKGLYAAGEVAGGQHGANRPGGNALLDTQVFGKVAGSSAASFAAATALPPTDVARLAAVQTKISGMQTARGLGAGAARKQL
ncbi:MAG: FAD-binding protein, partial [Planctomycetes bacterium]|nr:FAD-binding protein [Planctomycetota bacterium]